VRPASSGAYLGRGFYYGAGMSEAPFCRNEHVFEVGGANSAGQAAMYLTGYAAKVTMPVRGPTFKGTMSSNLYNRILTHPKIEVRFNAEVAERAGDNGLALIALTDLQSKTTDCVDASRLFECIGGAPNTEWAKDTPIIRDASGFLITGPDLLDNGQWPMANGRHAGHPSVSPTTSKPQSPALSQSGCTCRVGQGPGDRRGRRQHGHYVCS
jgi:thioredoxin reductase (NADPH)